MTVDRLPGNPAEQHTQEDGIAGEEQEHRFTVQGQDRTVGYTLMRESRGGTQGWAVRIDGIPAPSIIHDVPWPTIEDACAAAERAIEAILVLEKVQRDEVQRTGA